MMFFFKLMLCVCLPLLEVNGKQEVSPFHHKCKMFFYKRVGKCNSFECSFMILILNKTNFTFSDLNSSYETTLAGQTT
jgi:hypothetical protein